MWFCCSYCSQSEAAKLVAHNSGMQCYTGFCGLQEISLGQLEQGTTTATVIYCMGRDDSYWILSWIEPGTTIGTHCSLITIHVVDQLNPESGQPIALFPGPHPASCCLQWTCSIYSTVLCVEVYNLRSKSTFCRATRKVGNKNRNRNLHKILHGQRRLIKLILSWIKPGTTRENSSRKQI